MFKKKIKMDIPSQTRIEIIHTNFFNLLKEKKITQKKYSEDNNIPESTISKWKSYTSNMNEEHIYQAAKYFEVSVNTLYYTQQELKQLSVLEVSEYDPILAQQQVEIEHLDTKVSSYMEFCFASLIIAAMLGFFINYLLEDINSIWPLIFVVALPIISTYLYKSFLIDKQIFIINYLDQIYYKIHNKKNQYFVLMLIISVISLILGLLGICYIAYFMIVEYYDFLTQLLFLFVSVFTIMSLLNLSNLRLNFKESIYYYEIEGFENTLKIFIVGIVVLLLAIPFSTYYISFAWSIIFFALLPILTFINVILYAKKLGEYKLVLFDQKDNAERELFKK